MIDRNRYESLADALTEVDDLDAAARAVEREREIRLGMMRTGQGREPVAEFLDAQAAMSEEIVLELTDGEPTTLADALRRYIGELEHRGDTDSLDHAETLATILDFPWSQEEKTIQLHNPHYGLALHFREEKNRDLTVMLGNNRWPLTRVSWEDAGSGGLAEVQRVAELLYRAILARVIPDRDHMIHLNQAELSELRRFLVDPNGSAWIGGRLTVNAVEGGAVAISTRPYAHQHVPR